VSDVDEQRTEPEASGAPDEPRTLYRPRIRLGAVVALAAAAGLGTWAVLGSRETGSSSTPAPPAPGETTATARPIAPVGLSAKGLRTLTATVGAPIYWAGPKPGYLYELTRTRTGTVFIRYLPPGAQVGSKQAIYLVVATYPFRNALQALKNLNTSPQLTIPGGGIAIVDQKHPESVHLAYPGTDNQVEIYDPSPARSLAIAKSGDVRPVTPRPSATTTTTP
jgi:hypothetical protein